MSVRTTLSEADTAEVDVVPDPLPTPAPLLAPVLGPDTGLPVVEVPGEPAAVDMPGEPPVVEVPGEPAAVDMPGDPPVVVGRLALRQARRKRQLTVAACVVVVAVLLAITIMILGIARDRPGTPASPGAAASIGPILLAPSL